MINVTLENKMQIYLKYSNALSEIESEKYIVVFSNPIHQFWNMIYGCKNFSAQQR